MKKLLLLVLLILVSNIGVAQSFRQLTDLEILTFCNVLMTVDPVPKKYLEMLQQAPGTIREVYDQIRCDSKSLRGTMDLIRVGVRNSVVNNAFSKIAFILIHYSKNNPDPVFVDYVLNSKIDGMTALDWVASRKKASNDSLTIKALEKYERLFNRFGGKYSNGF